MSHTNNAEAALTLTCNFCGSQTANVDRCTGCGATSLTRPTEPLTPAIQTLVQQGAKAQQHMNTIAVALALGLLVVTWTICSPILFGTKDSGQQAQQHTVPSPQRLAVTPAMMLELKPLTVADMPVPSLNVHSMFKSKPLEYQPAGSTWGATFNPSNKTPDSGYSAYYFNTAAPGRLVHHEEVANAAVLYADDFHGISPADFGAYWVGSFELEKTQLVELEVTQKKAKARIVIDGLIVYDRSISSKRNKTVVRLDKGKHLVEIEYMSREHISVNFSAEIKPYSGSLSQSNLKKILANSIPGSYDFHYVGVERSNNTDRTVRLNVEESDKQLVLVLSSDSPVNWYLSNPHRTDIAAIVYGASRNQSTVMGDVDSSIILLEASSRMGRYTAPPGCFCLDSGPVCRPSRDFIDTKRKVEDLGYGKITGMSNRKTASAIKVPQRVMTPGMFEVELELHAKNQQRAAQACKLKNPAIADLFPGN